jgi:hypothetical protein
MAKVQKKPVDYAGWERQEAGKIRVGSLLTGLDLFAREIERKWGAERLRLLVDDNLREKFDRQKYLLKVAQYEGTVEDVEEQVRRMKNAYAALERAAIAAGADQINPAVWEGVLENGKVVAIVRDTRDVQLVANQAARGVIVWSMADVLKLIEAQTFANDIKEKFPGSKITAIGGTGAGAFDDLDDDSI